MNTIGTVRGAAREGSTLLVDCGERQAALAVCTERILRVRMLPAEDYGELEDIVVPRRDWAGVDARLEETATGWLFVHGRPPRRGLPRALCAAL